MRTVAQRVFVFTTLVAVSATAQIEVGPGRAYEQLSDVAPDLVPGDLVLVDGDATYDPVVFDIDGSVDNEITIRGVPVNGKLPVIQGGTRTIELAGDHYVLENLEITGGSSSCLFHHADEIVVRGVVVHGCPNHGILGADDDSGSLLLEYSEVYGSGEGTQHHQIYMATDENAHPGSVFRMQHCYVHDSTGGNSVKSRAERAEIYYNWIEGARYHELELIGPDEGSATPPDPLAYREDSDVVGNVLRKAGVWSDSFTVRIGSDVLASEGANSTRGRYRFVHNTILLSAESGVVFRLFGLLESVEMHDNVVFRDGGGAISLIRENDAEMAWISGRQVAGSNNWVSEGSADVEGWIGTLFGTEPMFVDFAGLDLTPRETSPLRDAANEEPMAASGFDFPGPLPAPLYLPPDGALEVSGSARARPTDGARDIGAYELGEAPTGSAGTGGDAQGGSAAGGSSFAGTSSVGSGGMPSASTGGVAGDAGMANAGEASRDARDDGGCGCRLAGAPRSRFGLASIALAALLGARRLRAARSTPNGAPRG
jgi:hypothetical protein